MPSVLDWARRRKSVASIAAIAVIAGVPLTIAVLHKGFPVNDVKLDASDVWVTNGDKLQGGRLNHQIDELDAAVSGSSSKIDVLQDSSSYFLTDVQHGTVSKIDPAYVSLVDRITVPDDSQLGYGGNTLSILSPAGKLWVLPAAGHINFDASKTKPAAELGKGGELAVSKDGETFAVSTVKKQLVTVENPAAKATTTKVPVSARVQLTAVGDVAVMLDADGRTLRTSGGTSITLPQKGLQLQQPSEKSDDVVVSSGSGIMQAPLTGGTVRVVSAGNGKTVTSASQTSAPVQLNGCDYAAWAATGRYLYACDGKPATAMNIGEPVTGDDLRFRVNHDVIALNNLRNGDAWVVSSHMRLVQNWAQLKPNQTEVQGPTGEEKPVLQSYQDTLAQRTPNNRPPIAVDDNFGVRPGRTTELPVLDNDTDPDGDVLTITSLPQIPAAQGKLELIDGGRSLQFTPADGVTGTVSFRYNIDDGRGGTASAQVNAAIHPLTQNAAPASTRDSTADVEVGQSVSYDVLQDWLDPDGDDMYLVSATSTTQDGVQFTPDGYITFTSTTGQTGSKEVDFTVSDGKLSASGTLMITVHAQGTMDPVAVPDYAGAIAGTPVTIDPLDNDRSPSGAPLNLIGVKASGSGGLPFTVDQDKGTVTVSPNAEGEFYLTYTLGAGAKSTTGLIRVNVQPGADGDDPPIAVKDTAYVRAGESTTVNVLDNDVSPSGRVLAVRSVTKGQDASDLNVEMLDNTIVKITAPNVLPNQVQLSYTVSDGVGQSTAAISVVPIAPLVNHQPPVAIDDTATVRAGDIATVSVLDNDYSPDNEPFTLDPVLKDASQAGPGATAFVNGSTVRYEAPKTPGQYSVTYGITDKFGQKAQAVVTFVVTALDQSKDRAPEPDPLTVRAFAGSSIPVTVPLDGIDPDGDSVTLVGIHSQPSLGRIDSSTSTGFTYDAYPGSAGTDSFTYTVEDTAGKTATGTVRIGVIPRPTTADAPIAVNDTVEVKPGRTASVPVLDNDSDPNGYTISLEKKLGSVDPGLTASVHGKVVLIKAPEKQGAYVARYSITNGQGGTASAYVQVIVTPDAKPVYPTALDHVVEPDQVAAKTSVTVDALDGATNPSGLVSQLGLTVSGANAGNAKVDGNGTIVVKATDARQVVTYSVTDPETKLQASAFIIVPPHSDATAPPRIKPGIGEQIVAMGATKTWKLSDIVDVPSHRPIKLSGPFSVTATNSDGSAGYVNDQTIRFTAAKNYRGPASITFRVNDGHDAGVSSDRVTSLVLPITVGNTDQSDVPPTFTPPHEQLQPGEAPTVVDLRASSYHPNPAVLAKLTYSGLDSSSQNGITASLSGSSLTLAAPLGVQPGATATFHFTVSSGSIQIPGSVSVTVVSSTRPLASQRNAPQTEDLQRGKSVTLSDASGDAYWVDPFPGKPLVITSASAVSAPAGVTVSHTDSAITVAASSGASIGYANITYQVQDATKDPKRVVTGQLRVDIHDVPGQPGQPAIVSSGDSTVRLSITAPADNGKPITRYTITASGGRSITENSVGTFDFTGLTNGTPYSFTVFATNQDGDGAKSAASATVTPYGTPQAPDSATLKNSGNYAPTTMSLSWSKLSTVAQTGGGTITYSYNFDGGGWKDTAATSATIGGVGAGDHSFQVRATNSGGKTSTITTSNTVHVDDPPPPQPSVSIAKGSPISSATCNGTCYHFVTTLDHFPAGTYTLTFSCDGPIRGASPDRVTVTNTTSQTFTSQAYCGYTAAYVTVTPGGYQSPPTNFHP